MTEGQAFEILNDVIAGLWPDWKRTAAQDASWLRELRAFDFTKSVKVLKEMHFTKAGTYKSPPARKLLDELRGKARESTLEAHEKKPLLLYEIIKEGRTRGMRFYVPSGKPINQEAVVGEAERRRDGLIAMTNVQHVIYYADWEAELERRANPEEEITRRMSDDDKLRCMLAILDGPDRPAKRFIEEYVAYQKDRPPRKRVGLISDSIEL